MTWRASETVTWGDRAFDASLPVRYPHLPDERRAIAAAARSLPCRARLPVRRVATMGGGRASCARDTRVDAGPVKARAREGLPSGQEQHSRAHREFARVPWFDRTTRP